jgi:hypothetical protein
MKMVTAVQAGIYKFNCSPQWKSIPAWHGHISYVLGHAWVFNDALSIMTTEYQMVG